MRYRFVDTLYDIVVRQALTGAGAKIDVTSVTLDGVAQPDGSVRLVDDRGVHQVSVEVRTAGKRGQTRLPVESLV